MCGATQSTRMWAAKGFEWSRCEVCRSLQVTHLPTPETLDELYSKNYYEGYKEDYDMRRYVDYIGQRSFIQGNLKRRVTWAQKHLALDAEATWLDVGCAAGFLLDVVHEHGFLPYGLDYSDFGPEYAQRELHMPNVRQGTIDALPEDFPRVFDVISYIDVLEHIPCPQDILQKSIDLVAPGGYLIGETFDPNSWFAQTSGAKWHAIDPPNHLNIMSLKAIDNLMVSRGLSLVARGSFPRTISVPTIASKLYRQAAPALYRSPLRNLGIPLWFNDVVIWMYRKS
ncbi:MAG: class I SAM-dependent methyltransferase [Anaerolineae bacterium]|nr:class I SAM-dependent methyltransferase [Anaerolineae bacterium]